MTLSMKFVVVVVVVVFVIVELLFTCFQMANDQLRFVVVISSLL
jgi:hypothetical protein